MEEKHGKIMGKSWENHGKMGKSWENHGKMGKSWENHGKIMGKSTLHGGFFLRSQWQTTSGMVHVPTIDAVDY